MKALVVAPQPFFSPRGTPFSVYYRTLVTSELGVDVDLLTYGEGQDVAIPRVRVIRIPRLRGRGGVKVGPSALKAVLDVVLALRTFLLLLRNRYDFVHAHEEAVFFCRFLKPLFRFRLVYDMHSSLPQQLRNFEFTKSRLLIAGFRWLEDTSLRAADAVITISPDLARYALERLDDPDKHFLIENSLLDEVKLARPAEGGGEAPAATAAARLARDRRLIAYAGTLEPYQGIDVLLHAFRALHARTPGAYLVVIGGDEGQVARYADLAKSLGIAAHCHFTGRLEQADARAWCRRAAVQVSPRLRGTNTPLKVYEQLASGVPLVATDIPAHTQVLDERVAFLARPEPDALAGAIEKALTQADEREARTEAARRLYRERYSRDAYVSKMKQVLGRVA